MQRKPTNLELKWCTWAVKYDLGNPLGYFNYYLDCVAEREDNWRGSGGQGTYIPETLAEFIFSQIYMGVIVLH